MGLYTGGAYTRVQNCSFCNVGLYTGGAYTQGGLYMGKYGITVLCHSHTNTMVEENYEI